LIVSEGGL